MNHTIGRIGHPVAEAVAGMNQPGAQALAKAQLNYNYECNWGTPETQAAALREFRTLVHRHPDRPLHLLPKTQTVAVDTVADSLARSRVLRASGPNWRRWPGWAVSAARRPGGCWPGLTTRRR